MKNPERASLVPKRVQLSRAKGWRMPENTVKVARPGRWGNPFRVGGLFTTGKSWLWCQTVNAGEPGFTLIETNAMAVDFYKRMSSNWSPRMVEEARNDLGGKNLACWCKPDEACHADVLLLLANHERHNVRVEAGPAAK